MGRARQQQENGAGEGKAKKDDPPQGGHMTARRRQKNSRFVRAGRNNGQRELEGKDSEEYQSEKDDDGAETEDEPLAEGDGTRIVGQNPAYKKARLAETGGKRSRDKSSGDSEEGSRKKFKPSTQVKSGDAPASTSKLTGPISLAGLITAKGSAAISRKSATGTSKGKGSRTTNLVSSSLSTPPVTAPSSVIDKAGAGVVESEDEVIILGEDEDKEVESGRGSKDIDSNTVDLTRSTSAESPHKSPTPLDTSKASSPRKFEVRYDKVFQKGTGSNPHFYGVKKNEKAELKSFQEAGEVHRYDAELQSARRALCRWENFPPEFKADMQSKWEVLWDLEYLYLFHKTGDIDYIEQLLVPLHESVIAGTWQTVPFAHFEAVPLSKKLDMVEKYFVRFTEQNEDVLNRPEYFCVVVNGGRMKMRNDKSKCAMRPMPKLGPRARRSMSSKQVDTQGVKGKVGKTSAGVVSTTAPSVSAATSSSQRADSEKTMRQLLYMEKHVNNFQGWYPRKEAFDTKRA